MSVSLSCRSLSAAHTSMPMYMCTTKRAGSLQGGGIGAVALAVLYAFQERLVRCNLNMCPSKLMLRLDLPELIKAA